MASEVRKVFDVLQSVTVNLDCWGWDLLIRSLLTKDLCLPGVKGKSHSLIRLGKDINDCLKLRFRVSTLFSVFSVLELNDRSRAGLGSESETVEVEQLTVYSVG